MDINKFDPARLPDPDTLGFFVHPDVPGEDESDDAPALLDAMGFKFSVIGFLYDGNEDDVDTWFFGNTTADEMKEIMMRWKPISPSGDGWILAAKYDTEDGPYALFVCPTQPTEGG